MIAGDLPAGLRMRVQASAADGVSDEPRAESESASEAVADPRVYRGPTAVRDEPDRRAPWRNPGAAPVDADPTDASDPDETDATSSEGDATPPSHGVTAKVPPPSSVRDVPTNITVAVGLGPQAPGSRDEKALLGQLQASVDASTDPTTTVRRLRAGMGEPRRICRDQRDDLVVMIDYVADREDPVVVAHDCRLDRALSVRAAAAAREPGLVGALWDEHLALMRAGVTERRRWTVGPRARRGIIAGVAIVVVGVAVGALVANALREETVVITVRP